MSPQRCETCRFFKSGDDKGKCRRFPPTMATNGLAVSPSVAPTDWCGEWAATAPGKPAHA